jgi:nucleotide-binding universal stress UspA family protein
MTKMAMPPGYERAYAEAWKPDLIVLGSRHAEAAVAAVAAHAPCSVEAVHLKRKGKKT